MVSFRVSPFEDDVVEASENPITRPPRRLTAVSKLNLVRVEGSKKRVPTTFPAKNLGVGMSLELPRRLQKVENLFLRQAVD